MSNRNPLFRCPRSALSVLVLLTAAPAVAAAPKAPPASQPAVKAQRVFVCGHSFHVFVARPLEELAGAAGISGHVNAGVQFIGGSSVTQHWNVPDARNRAKQAAAAGKIDVLTLSPAWLMPDPAIDKFVELALKHNRDVRVVVQQSWSAWDGLLPPNRITRNEQRDGVTIAQLRPPLELMRKGIEAQLRAINGKLGRQVVFLAPVGDAVLLLREKVIAGQAPGITKQSQLFRDPIGHGTEPVQRLAAYVHFAVVYRRSPVGLRVFQKPGNDDWNRLNRLLQQLAWQAVQARPLSGMGGAPDLVAGEAEDDGTPVRASVRPRR